MADVKNRSHMSTTQKKRLADIMATKNILRSGKFTANFTKKDAQREWEEIEETLNALPGATKTWQSWRKSWQDLLSKTKGKKGAITKSLNRTGGGRPEQALDEVEENIISLIDPRSVTGHRESQESEAAFDFDTQFEMGVDEIQIPSDEEVTVVQIVPDQAEENQEKQKQKKNNLKSLMKEKLELKKKITEAKIQFYVAVVEREKNKLLHWSRLLGPYKAKAKAKINQICSSGVVSRL